MQHRRKPFQCIWKHRCKVDREEASRIRRYHRVSSFSERASLRSDKMSSTFRVEIALPSHLLFISRIREEETNTEPAKRRIRIAAIYARNQIKHRIIRARATRCDVIRSSFRWSGTRAMLERSRAVMDAERMRKCIVTRLSEEMCSRCLRVHSLSLSLSLSLFLSLSLSRDWRRRDGESQGYRRISIVETLMPEENCLNILKHERSVNISISSRSR
jgi:hypothetical protein